jgi:hypothetical protein
VFPIISPATGPEPIIAAPPEHIWQESPPWQFEQPPMEQLAELQPQLHMAGLQHWQFCWPPNMRRHMGRFDEQPEAASERTTEIASSNRVVILHLRVYENPLGNPTPQIARCKFFRRAIWLAEAAHC